MTTKMGNVFETRIPDAVGKGSRNDVTLRNAFSRSPIYNYEDAHVKERFVNEVQRGNVTDGFGFPDFSRDYDNAPNLDGNIESNTPSENTPAYAPNVSTDQDTEVAASKHSEAPFVGAGHLENPHNSSRIINRLKIGSYMMGKSSPQN